MLRSLPLLVLAGLLACSSPEPVPAPADTVPAPAAKSTMAEPPPAPIPAAGDAPAVALPHPSDSGAGIRKAVDQYLAEHPVDRSRADWRLALAPPPTLRFPAGAQVEWLLDTDAGPLRFRLLADTAPAHVANAIYLSQIGFYDGLTFHRVIPGFMAQGGCPLGDGTGGPGYRFAGEFAVGAPSHVGPGVLSMANAGPGTDGSQFFVTFKATPWLDGNHTIYGTLVEGRETLIALEKLGTRSGQPVKPIRILTARTLIR